jgi:hypothetical protein
MQREYISRRHRVSGMGTSVYEVETPASRWQLTLRESAETKLNCSENEKCTECDERLLFLQGVMNRETIFRCDARNTQCNSNVEASIVLYELR